MTAAKVFVDTNVIVYAYDSTAGRKRETAAALLGDLWDSGLGTLSTQVLEEFFMVVTRKIPNPLPAGTARGIVVDLLAWDVVTITGDTIMEAIDLHLKRKLSFWDSLILCSAAKAGAGLLLTEDFSDGQVIEGLKIHNPFK